MQTANALASLRNSQKTFAAQQFDKHTNVKCSLIFFLFQYHILQCLVEKNIDYRWFFQCHIPNYIIEVNVGSFGELFLEFLL